MMNKIYSKLGFLIMLTGVVSYINFLSHGGWKDIAGIFFLLFTIGGFLMWGLLDG